VKRIEGLASARAKKVVNLLQTPPPPEPRQILLQVKFAAIDRVALQEIGFQSVQSQHGLIGETSTEQFASPRFSQLQFQNQSFSNSTVNFATCSTFSSTARTSTLAPPSRRCRRKPAAGSGRAEPDHTRRQGGQFLAGGSFPFPVLTSTSTGGSTAPVVHVQFKQFGVQLNFTPTVTASAPSI